MSLRPIRPQLEALDGRVLLSGVPTLSVGDATVFEASDGIRYAEVVVSLSKGSTRTIQVSYGTADGTAQAGSDFAAVSGKLTFAPGETTKTILVPVIDDGLAEPDETFFVDLSGAQHAKIADGQGTVTIIDDDEPGIGIDNGDVDSGGYDSGGYDFYGYYYYSYGYGY
jgi:hypothetical protein